MVDADIIQGAIQFFGPYDRPSSAGLKLWNNSRHSVIFRLKCSRPVDFTISPGQIGILPPNESQLLTLTTLPYADHAGQSNVLLEYTSVSSPDQTDLLTAWSNVKGEDLTKTALKVVYSPNQADPDEAQTTVIAIWEIPRKKNASVAEVAWRLRRRRPDVWESLQILLLVLAAISLVCGVFVGSKFKRSLVVTRTQSFRDL